MKNGARYLIWSKDDQYSLKWFGEMGEKGYASTQIEYQGRTYQLTCFPIYFSEDKNTIVFHLKLAAKASP